MTRAHHRKPWSWLLVSLIATTAVACGQSPGHDAASGPSRRQTSSTEALYVLDPNGESLTSRVVRLDVGSQRVERSFPAGYDPAMTVSPDGATLYVASAHQRGDGSLDDVLTVIDAGNGGVRSRTRIEDRWEGGAVTTHPTMTTSLDGLWLYVLQARLTGSDGAAYSVATFDTTRQEFLPETVPLEGCGAGFLVPSPHEGGRRLQVACPLTHDVRIVEVSSSGAAASSETVELPRTEDGRTDSNRNPLELWRLSAAVASPSADRLYAVTQNGRVSVIDLISKELTDSVDLGLDSDEFIPIGHVAGAGGQLFVGTAPLVSESGGIDRLRATGIAMVDTSDWEVDATAAPEAAFEAMAVSSSGDEVFTVDTEEQSVTVIDPQDASHRAVIRRVGTTPTRAETVVSPGP